jgi:hypothetical protein
MGATSVTGVGAGSAAEYGAGNKGSEHMSLAVHRLIGPRVCAAGSLTLNGSGYGTVYYPSLPYNSASVLTEYVPFLSTNNATAPYWGSFTASSFAVTGGDNATVCWEIVKAGLWGSLENDGPSSVIANT